MQPPSTIENISKQGLFMRFFSWLKKKGNPSTGNVDTEIVDWDDNYQTTTPWIHKTTFAIGGLLNVGYAPNSDLLIVLSSQGEGIFDCIKGEKIAREHNDMDWYDRFNKETNTIIGFDCLANIEIPTYGLEGTDNEMLKETSDGWTLTISEPEPEEKPYDKYLIQKIYLVTPDKKEKIFIEKDGPCELRAYGFSETGNTFIVALSCDLVIYCRE